MTYELKQFPGLIQKPTQIQKLILTPQLQQAIRLLQLSRLDLLETINNEMEANPMLEEQQGEDSDEEQRDSGDTRPIETVGEEVIVKESIGEDMDWENYLSEHNTGWAGSPYEDRDTPSFENFTANETNLTSHLIWQLGMSDFTDTQKEIGVHIIGNLNEDGYPRSAPFFLMSRRVQPPTIRWFQNSILLSLRFSSRFSISSAKRSRRRGQGD